jgi:hypothetical protein
MELALQEFIASVEKLSDLRNLDQFNPIFFQMEHPTSATRFTVVGSKVTPSYLGVPINVTWVVLDPTSPYFRQALKLKDTLNPDTVTSLPKEADPLNAWWHVVRTYAEIFVDPQYYVNAQQGPKGDKGDPGVAGIQGIQGPAGADGVWDPNAFLQLAFNLLGTLPGTLTIEGPDNVGAGSSNQYDVFLDEKNFDPNGELAWTHLQVYPHLEIVGATPAGVSISGSNVLTVGAVSQDETIQLVATYPSWTKMLNAFKDVTVKAATAVSLNISGNNPIFAGKSENLTATVTFSDGTTAVSAVSWSVDDAATASINAAGRITGVSSITADKTVQVTATYNAGGVTLTDTKPVLVKQVVLTALTVLGATSILGNTTSAYNARATYNSGDTAVVNASWSVDVNIATINSSGVLTPNNTSGQVNVSASYTDATGTKTGSLQVTITAVIAQIAPFYGTGPALPPDWSAFVNALPHRGTGGSVNASVQIDCIGQDTFMYFAAPASYGAAQFFDVISQFVGGWGGAGNNAQGPSAASIAAGVDTPLQTNVVINGTAVPFYIYRSDFANLGPASGNKWTVSPAA